ncbi:MAG: glycoside hydrolase family 2 TIM barrel-domain containing protein, partial [Luteolibacter sp.]
MIPHLFVSIFCLTTGLLVTSASAQSQPAPRERTLFNDGWRFQKDDPSGTGDALGYGKIREALLASASGFVDWKIVPRSPAADAVKLVSYVEPSFDDSSWRKVNLPHDWGIEGPFDQNLPGETGKLPWHGVGWYRKDFQVSAPDQKKQIYLQIDGAMSYSAVWLNGKFVGGWPYGYSSYQLDLTPYLQAGENTLAIRLDNPKDSSRWYPGSGLYRNVWIVKTNPIHLATWGTHITTPKVAASSASVDIGLRLLNPTNQKVTLAASIYELDASGRPGAKPVASVRLPEDQKSAADGSFHAILDVKNPQRWTLGKPQLYLAITGILTGGALVDRVETTFGIRTIEFTSDNGFLLNGERVPIQGVCMHHDLGALGSAFNTRASERQIQILKEMGVNAIRTAHNPPAPEFLDLCDRMGILVMDEFSDAWKKRKKPNGYQNMFEDWSEKDIRAMARRDRNHPSVILWSLGNEIPEQGAPEGPAMQKVLGDFVKKEDSTRPLTMGVSDGRAGYNGFQKGLDVFGYNYKPWEYKKFHEQNPLIPLVGSETASTLSSRGE